MRKIAEAIPACADARAVVGARLHESEAIVCVIHLRERRALVVTRSMRVPNDDCQMTISDDGYFCVLGSRAIAASAC